MNLLQQTLGGAGLPQSLAENTLVQSLMRPFQYAAKMGEPRIEGAIGNTLLSPAETAAAIQRAVLAQATAPNQRLSALLRKLSAGPGAAVVGPWLGVGSSAAQSVQPGQ
jgi:hypothetical protein